MTIVNYEGKFYVLNKAQTKKLAGPYDNYDDALKRLRQIEYFKRHKK